MFYTSLSNLRKQLSVRPSRHILFKKNICSVFFSSNVIKRKGAIRVVVLAELYNRSIVLNTMISDSRSVKVQGSVVTLSHSHSLCTDLAVSVSISKCHCKLHSVNFILTLFWHHLFFYLCSFVDTICAATIRLRMAV